MPVRKPKASVAKVNAVKASAVVTRPMPNPTVKVNAVKASAAAIRPVLNPTVKVNAAKANAAVIRPALRVTARANAAKVNAEAEHLTHETRTSSPRDRRGVGITAGSFESADFCSRGPD